MEITLNKRSDVPLRQQLAEQIVFLITTGELCAGQRLPSVRALARRVGVHHNTVSEAYQDLVRRRWVTGRRGSRLVVGGDIGSNRRAPLNLDDLINQTIERAKEMGYSLAVLTEHVRKRLLAEPPDHILVIEHEQGLSRIIQKEVADALSWTVKTCSPESVAKEPVLLVGAQVFAPPHIIQGLGSLVPGGRPGVPVIFCGADQQIQLIRKLKKPSIVAAISVSESMLKIALGLLAPAIGRKHSFRTILLSENEPMDLQSVDLAFCDSVAIDVVGCRHKVRYRLVEPSCLVHLASTLRLPVLRTEKR